ncbi:DUF6624 domain-containing protein [Flammeovirga sp. EKP202]|uniref:DUF6624 domain-containing protein n=1 Tax=Flammeovirga sp. EKP202 TaxID=2770592 RepID=UPI00165FBC86|nr:DUF6624 domain-containing protein [Flammeovirga sp. EKP202]MBD0401909.1 hypothetical protein [Flammeovirga sp. EKP202]
MYKTQEPNTMLKNKTTTLLLSLFLFFTSCNLSDPHGIKKLVKLDQEDVIEITLNNFDKETKPPIYRYKSGEVISLDKIKKTDPLEWGYDYYASSNHEIKVVILRKPTHEDTLFQRRLIAAIKERKRTDVELVDIDCDKIDKMLAHIRFMDQENRSSGMVNENIELENLTKVVSILEICGMPTVEEVGNNGINTVWIIIQHAGPHYRSKYFHLFEDATERGDLQPYKLAMMEDMIFLDSGKPQKYGSQIVFNSKTGEMEIYSLQDPANVNHRRAQVGLEPIEDYMGQFESEE